MQSIRLEIPSGGVAMIDIGCECGNSSIRLASSSSMFKHRVQIGGRSDYGVCESCGRRVCVEPQASHIHIFDAGVPSSK
jgi:hypothetical protein